MQDAVGGLDMQAQAKAVAAAHKHYFSKGGGGWRVQEAVVVGGLDMRTQAQALAARPHVVVATPGRLRGLLAADAGLADGFARTRFLVLDEADRLLVLPQPLPSCSKGFLCV